ncbi:MAG: GntR family transcriptional regulator [Ruminococcus sp.]|nr:GntR family transcriptional regulator [Ruminococcus sp.]
MGWNFDNDKPIYLQICERIKNQLATGEIGSGEKIKPVREFALEAGVNPNTMQKALSELEKEGFLISERTSGRRATDNTEDIRVLKLSLADTATGKYLLQMSTLGYGKQQTSEFILNYGGNENGTL